MRKVILESPFAGRSSWAVIRWFQRWRNVRYARRCLLDSLQRGEAPLASHLLYTQALNDAEPHERRQGIKAGLEWGQSAEATVVYLDRGLSRGMMQGIEDAEKAGRKVERRVL